MDANAFDLGAEVSELVDDPLLSPPVELVMPVIDQLTHVLKVGPVIPACTCNLVGPTDASEAVGEIVDDRLWNVNRKWLDHVL